jgi:cell division protein FtsB
MDEKRTDLKAALRELAAEESGDVGPHVGSKRLIAYREGMLAPAEREAVQEHLSLCARCTGLLLELRDFEASSARGDTGPESLRQEAWESLVQRLPTKPPAVRPLSPREAPRRRFPRFVLAAAAALLLVVLGFTAWIAVTAQREHQRNAEITALRNSLASTERQLDTARRQIQDLERERKPVDREQPALQVDQLKTRVAELTSALEKLRRQAPKTRGQTVVASRGIEVSVSPRFAVRGQENPESNLLRGQGTINPVRIAPQTGRVTVALSLADHPVYGEYRLELMDRDGEVLWSAHRPGKSLLGDAGTKVSVSGLEPGLYRLRIEGLQPERGELGGEYILKVE